MKFARVSGLYAAGLLCLTIQMLILLFEYVVNALGFTAYIINNGASIAGLALLLILFVRRKEIGIDIVLTVIGMLLWVVQFVQVFRNNPEEVIASVITCSVGFVGIMLILMGLFVEVVSEKNKK